MLKQLFSAACLLIISTANYAETALNSQIMLTQSEQQTMNAKQLTLKLEAAAKIKVFATKLKGALVTAIKEQGMSHAVAVCQTQAPKIAEQLSTDGWTIRRTSLKTRNPNNRANVWEAEALSSFDKEYKAGIPIQDLTAEKLSDSEYRFMKAIPTDKVCLACHGSSVNTQLLSTIDTYYPKDSATGFTLEDIRGAFTLSKSL